MTHNQYPDSDAPPSPHTHELAPEVLEKVLQPDQPLAAQALDRSIAEAEADPETDPEALDLLRFQRGLVDMSPGEAGRTAYTFALETGKHSTVVRTFDNDRQPDIDLHYEINREAFLPRIANEERWRVVGIDPAQYNETAYGRSYTQQIENSWWEARKARQDLEASQAVETKAMERASHLLLPDEPKAAA